MRIRIELVQPRQVTAIKCSIENICSKSRPISYFLIFCLVMQELGIGQYHVLGIEYVLATKKKKRIYIMYAANTEKKC